MSTSGGTTVTAASAVETLVAVGSLQDLAEPLRPGRTFSFQLTFTNPLYDAVKVLVELLGPLDEEEEIEDGEDTALQGDDDSKVEVKRPWSVSMPISTFGINPYAEAWEYEDEEDEVEVNSDGPANAASVGSSSRRHSKHGPGVLARKGNKTAVQLDLAIGREAAAGELRVPLFITYTYTVDETLASTAAKKKSGEVPQVTEDEAAESKQTAPLGQQDSTEAPNANVKSFSFWASISLGKVVPRTAIPGGSTLIVPSSDGEARRVPSSSNLRGQ